MAKTVKREAQRPDITLPKLRTYEGRGLQPDGDYDGLRFEDLDLGGTDGAGATFLDCGVYRCGLDEAGLGRARLLDSVLEGISGVGTRLEGAELRDVELRDARLGSTQWNWHQRSRRGSGCGSRSEGPTRPRPRGAAPGPARLPAAARPEAKHPAPPRLVPSLTVRGPGGRAPDGHDGTNADAGDCAAVRVQNG
ncbi:pentapeptide repeat-containing protein [Streptomyces sp. NPDC050617]|uniref:pentapeptide repeat-containing protein n=1 Tax=Streptomyces sp. NPDC050617 TaxID=3154628 RepID=UPI00343E98CD